MQSQRRGDTHNGVPLPIYRQRNSDLTETYAFLEHFVNLNLRDDPTRFNPADKAVPFPASIETTLRVAVPTLALRVPMPDAHECREQPCHIYVWKNPDRLTYMNQHGENPEHTLEVDAALPKREAAAQVVAWLERLHDYEARDIGEVLRDITSS